MIRWLADRVNIWVFIGAIVVAGGLVALAGLLILFSPAPAPAKGPAADLTIIPAPTPTATRPPVIATPTVTAAPVIGGISVGSYVQISGTEGAGLRLRAAAGTAHAMRFVGMDSEVFLVKQGPQEADGFTWWFLEAPYDPSRSGWAASNYLTVVEAVPSPTP